MSWCRGPPPGRPGAGATGRWMMGRPPGSPRRGPRRRTARRVRRCAGRGTPRDVREVDDEVDSLGQAEDDPVVVVGGEVDGTGEEPTLVADNPHLDARDPGEVEDEEPGLAPVEHPEPVAPLFDVEVRPCAAVDHDGVPEELGVPRRGDVGVRDVGTLDAVEEGAGVGVEERAVRAEGPVLDGERRSRGSACGTGTGRAPSAPAPAAPPAPRCARRPLPRRPRSHRAAGRTPPAPHRR